MDNTPSPSSRIKLLILILGLSLVAATSMVYLYARQESPIPQSASKPVVNLKQPLVRPELVVSGVTSPTTIAATTVSGDKRLFVTQQAGQIRLIDATGKLQDKPFLDVSDKLNGVGEAGLLGLAFDPNYQKNGYFFVNYVDKDFNTVIARYSRSSDADAADPASAKLVLTLKQPYPNHNGGDLLFGPDGYLYAPLGDGGSGGDPENRSQDKSTLFGKILRLDVDKGDPYAIPASNPFAKETGSRPEIWAYGLRNPWRVSFDKKTGDLYIADVGQGKTEEIDVQKASSKGGENYGWRCYEGDQPYNADGCKSADNYVAPVLEYAHEQGRCSVTGGYVYRGSRYRALQGKYFYSDFCTGQLFFASETRGKWASTEAAKTPYQISTFGEAGDGELYLADYKTGSIYHVRDVANGN